MGCWLRSPENQVRQWESIQQTDDGRTWKQEDRTLLDRDISEFGAINHFEKHVSFPLVKPFLRHECAEIASAKNIIRENTHLRLVNVVIISFVGTTNEHDDEVLSFVDGVITNGRLEQMSVFLKPLGDVDWW